MLRFQSKLAQESIVCPRALYPFVRGAHNEIFDRLTTETGAKINIPPSQATSEVGEIIIVRRLYLFKL